MLPLSNASYKLHCIDQNLSCLFFCSHLQHTIIVEIAGMAAAGADVTRRLTIATPAARRFTVIHYPLPNPTTPHHDSLTPAGAQLLDPEELLLLELADLAFFDRRHTNTMSGGGARGDVRVARHLSLGASYSADLDAGITAAGFRPDASGGMWQSGPNSGSGDASGPAGMAAGMPTAGELLAAIQEERGGSPFGVSSQGRGGGSLYRGTGQHTSVESLAASDATASPEPLRLVASFAGIERIEGQDGEDVAEAAARRRTSGGSVVRRAMTSR